MRVIAVNERGLRIGEDHQNAVLTNRDVELLLGMHAQGWGYRRLSAAFEISKAQVRRIVHGQQRCQIVAVHRLVPVRIVKEITLEA